LIGLLAVAKSTPGYSFTSFDLTRHLSTHKVPHFKLRGISCWFQEYTHVDAKDEAFKRQLIER